jgi:acyl-CoA thioester hydrolase
MGVVHHSNYAKFFEDARVAWLREEGMIAHHQPYGPFVFAVIAINCRFFRPARFDDALEVWTQAKLERGLRIHFQYALWSETAGRIIADGRTELVALTADLKPHKLPPELAAIFARQPWREEWPPGPR